MAEKKNIPALRFPEFSELWSEKTFGDLYSFKPTNSFSRDMLNYEAGEVKNIHYGDIHTKFSSLFDIEKEIVPYINSGIKISRITEENYVQEGDLILADASEDYNDIGKSIEVLNLNNEKVLSGLHTILARRKTDDLSIGFVAFLMKTYNVRLEIMRIAQGSKVLGLSSRRLAEVPLWLPKPNEQKKIAIFLTSIDKRINLLSKQKMQLELYKKGLMHKIFNQELRFKDKNGEEFPEWDEKKLGDICEYKNGGSFENEVIENGSYHLITLNSIDINGKLKPNHKKVGRTDNSLKKGDLIMVLSDVAHGNFLGLTDIIPDDFYVLNQRMGALKPKIQVNTYYLKSYININQRYFKLMGQGSSQQNLSKNDILEFEVLLPNLIEQKKIASFFSAMDLQIEDLIIQINLSLDLRKGLLQKLFV